IIAGQNQIGEQAIENLLQQFSQRQDVEMVGTLSQQELAMLMKRVHCTIIPSEWIEIGPLVFHEAIAAGSDVIASDIGGCKELSEKYFKKSKSFNVGNSASLKKTIENFTYSSAKMQTTTQLDNYNAVELSYNHLLKTGVINTSI
ncbi:MAG TPA: glycosyltransferase, partial [Ferruginibacter sp.]|nr:glycosyltransferase [Ferruginibacter sp.]